MKEHEHSTKNEPETKPSQDEAAKKAYAIYLKEGRPQGRDVQNWLEAETKMPHAGPDHHARHSGGFPEKVLDLTGLDPADSRSLADVPNAGGTARGVLLTPALGALLMSASTVIVAINARLLRLKK